MMQRPHPSTSSGFPSVDDGAFAARYSLRMGAVRSILLPTGEVQAAYRAEDNL
jgi:hypothetical protein